MVHWRFDNHSIFTVCPSKGPFHYPLFFTVSPVNGSINSFIHIRSASLSSADWLCMYSFLIVSYCCAIISFHPKIFYFHICILNFVSVIYHQCGLTFQIPHKFWYRIFLTSLSALRPCVWHFDNVFVLPYKLESVL